MKSLAIVTPFYPPHLGGMERALGRLSRALASRGVKVLVHTSSQGGPIDARTELDEFGISVRRDGEALREWAQAARKWCIALSGELDAALFASFGPETREDIGLAAAALAHCGINTVWRSPTADHACRNLGDGRCGLLSGIAIIVANGHASGDRTAEAIGRPVHVIPNMLLRSELDAARADAAAERLCDVAWVGRVTRRKRPEDLMRLLALLSLDHQVHIQAASSYGESDLYDRFVSAIPRRVHLHKAAQAQPCEIRRAAVFVHVSDVEGSPNAVLEAASRGSALLASNIPECTELLTGLNAATITAFGRPAQDAVDRLAKASTLATRLEQHGVIESRHSEENVVGQWLGVLFP